MRCTGCMAWPRPWCCPPVSQRRCNKLRMAVQRTHAYADGPPTAAKAAAAAAAAPPSAAHSQRLALAPAAGKRAAGDESGSEDEGQQQPRKALEDMSIDEFLQGGFLEAAPAGAAGDDSDGALRGLPGWQAVKDWHVKQTIK